jgi:hypothetical protein
MRLTRLVSNPAAFLALAVPSTAAAAGSTHRYLIAGGDVDLARGGPGKGGCLAGEPTRSGET